MGKYLVTGSAGFIGSRVCTCLLSEGHRVVGVDCLNDAYDVRLKHWRNDQLVRHPGFEFRLADICDREALREVFTGSECFDAVVNLAARAGIRASIQQPLPYYETNVLGVLNLLELCSERSVSKFVQASSSSVYGEIGEGPVSEDASTDRPLSPYAASKKAAESLCYSYHYLKGMNVTVLRYFTVYGPASRPDMSPFRFVSRVREGHALSVFGDGSQQRDFTYIDDIARGTVSALGLSGFEIVNLGSGNPVALIEFIRLVEELAGREAILHFGRANPGDVRRTWADTARANRLMGWAPRWSLEDGVSELVSWYEKNREWASKISTSD